VFPVRVRVKSHPGQPIHEVGQGRIPSSKWTRADAEKRFVGEFMSLVGNLEDLSLGDILQIISLSQKSGVLALSSEVGSGRIVFGSGLVQAARLKGAPNDLRDLLVQHGAIDPAGYDGAASRAEGEGVSIEEMLARDSEIDAERIEALVTQSAESAILEMFSWPSGDFSFDVRNELDPEDPQLVLPKGINAQYLAMEGLRLRDERERDQLGGGDAAVDPNAETDPNIGVAEDPLFGAEDVPETLPVLEVDEGPLDAVLLEDDFMSPVEPGPSDSAATDALVSSVVERADAEDDLSLEAIEAAMPLGEPLDPSRDEVSKLDIDQAPPAPTAPTAAAAEVVEGGEPPFSTASEATLPPVEAGPAATESVVEPAPAAVPAKSEVGPVTDARKMPVVLIDPDVTVLEWVKAAIEDEFARVHVFQQAEQGLSRIRQYLIRGQTPLVLLSPDTQIDPLSGIHGLGDFVKRLKAQSPRLVVLGLRDDDDAAPSAMPGSLNGVLRRPARRMLADRGSAEGAAASQVLSRALLEILAQQGPGRAHKSASGGAGSLRGLRDATAKLQEASSRGEILPVVLDFASEVFARVAILVVRDDEIFAIAGRGISALEVDPLDSSGPVTVPMPDEGWIREILKTGKALVGPPTTPADHLLLERFGGEIPKQAYLGPIESGASVIALLYGDQSVSEAPIPDTHGLEVVLHHAGLALDRAALERALWEVDADGR